jgi:hypothetical protein
MPCLQPDGLQPIWPLSKEMDTLFNNMDRLAYWIFRQTVSLFYIERGLAFALEADCDAPDHALRRSQHEQLVVDRGVCQFVAEQIAERHKHFPTGSREVQKRQ